MALCLVALEKTKAIFQRGDNKVQGLDRAQRQPPRQHVCQAGRQAYPISANGHTEDGKYTANEPGLVSDVIAFSREVPNGQRQCQKGQATDDPPELEDMAGAQHLP